MTHLFTRTLPRHLATSASALSSRACLSLSAAAAAAPRAALCETQQRKPIRGFGTGFSVSATRAFATTKESGVMGELVETPVRPRRFAPLGPSSRKTRAAEEEGIPRLRGIVFDVDGTLCEC
jgi:hypothetical protein